MSILNFRLIYCAKARGLIGSGMRTSVGQWRIKLERSDRDGLQYDYFGGGTWNISVRGWWDWNCKAGGLEGDLL